MEEIGLKEASPDYSPNVGSITIGPDHELVIQYNPTAKGGALILEPTIDKESIHWKC